jgi:SAM-dependent methyltransferase
MDDTEPDRYDPAAVVQVYDGMAADYALRHGAELSDPDSDTDFLDTALANLPDGPVLDVGCGPAQVCNYLHRHGRTAIGLDMAPGMLSAAARLAPQARLVAADLLALPLRPATCAGAVASYSLHHLPKARMDTALAGLRDALRPGGVLVVITHGGSGEQWLERPGGGIILSLYSADELADRLRAVGLMPEKISQRGPREGEFPADKIWISARRA